MNTSKKRLRFSGNLAYTLSAAFVIVAVVMNLFPPQPAFAGAPLIPAGAGNSGAIWTTLTTCGDSTQDTNHYSTGDHVYINGSGFDPNTSYAWDITGKPGGASGDPGQVVASGNFTTDSTGVFCFDAYTVAGDDWGEYQVKFGTKGDNYRVEALPVASASVSTGICTWTAQAGSSTPVTIALTSASLTINGVTYTSPTTINLPPGTYPYTWTASSGYVGSGSGTVVIGDCTPGSASASVSTGLCTWSEQAGSSTPVAITLIGASLTINGVTYTSSTTVNLPPGTYPYSWAASSGYVGSGSGTVVIGDCTPANASALVSTGICTWTEQAGSFTPVTITLTGALLTINGVTYTSSTTINLPPGTYPYTWAASSGYVGSGSGTIVVGDCTPGSASASVSTGLCIWNERGGSSTPVTITLIGASLTINAVTYTSSTTVNLPPGTYPYTWTALTGFVGSGSGVLTIGECVPPPVPTANIACYTLEFSAFKVTVGNSGPAGEIGYSTDLDATIVSLGTIANGGSAQILVPGNAVALYLYPASGSGWGTPVTVPLSAAEVRVCEEDPVGLSTFCSYVNLEQPFGWTVTNLNLFPISFTWIYGPESSAAPIPLVPGDSLSFATGNHTGNVMQIFVDGILLASTEGHEICPDFLSLQLTAICSNNPAVTHGWTASNPNAFPVDAEWRVNGSLLTGLLSIPANSSVNFTTPVAEGAIAQIYYGGVTQDDASAAQGCIIPEIPPETPPGTPPETFIPVTGGEPPVLIPVTGIADDFAGLAPVGAFSLSLGFFGLGIILHGIARRRIFEG